MYLAYRVKKEGPLIIYSAEVEFVVKINSLFISNLTTLASVPLEDVKAFKKLIGYFPGSITSIADYFEDGIYWKADEMNKTNVQI